MNSWCRLQFCFMSFTSLFYFQHLFTFYFPWLELQLPFNHELWWQPPLLFEPGTPWFRGKNANHLATKHHKSSAVHRQRLSEPGRQCSFSMVSGLFTQRSPVRTPEGRAYLFTLHLLLIVQWQAVCPIISYLFTFSQMASTQEYIDNNAQNYFVYNYSKK